MLQLRLLWQLRFLWCRDLDLQPAPPERDLFFCRCDLRLSGPCKNSRCSSVSWCSSSSANGRAARLAAGPTYAFSSSEESRILRGSTSSSSLAFLSRTSFQCAPLCDLSDLSGFERGGRRSLPSLRARGGRRSPMGILLAPVIPVVPFPTPFPLPLRGGDFRELRESPNFPMTGFRTGLPGAPTWGNRPAAPIRFAKPPRPTVGTKPCLWRSEVLTAAGRGGCRTAPPGSTRGTTVNDPALEALPFPEGTAPKRGCILGPIG